MLQTKGAVLEESMELLEWYYTIVQFVAKVRPWNPVLAVINNGYAAYNILMNIRIYCGKKLLQFSLGLR